MGRNADDVHRIFFSTASDSQRRGGTADFCLSGVSLGESQTRRLLSFGTASPRRQGISFRSRLYPQWRNQRKNTRGSFFKKNTTGDKERAYAALHAQRGC